MISFVKSLKQVLKEYQKMKACMAICSGYDTNVTYFPDRPRELSKKLMPCLRSHVTSNRNWWHSCHISGPWKSSSRLESGCNQNQIHLHVNRNLVAMVLQTLVTVSSDNDSKQSFNDCRWSFTVSSDNDSKRSFNDRYSVENLLVRYPLLKKAIWMWNFMVCGLP